MQGHGGFEVIPDFHEHPDGTREYDFQVKKGEFRFQNPGFSPDDYYEEEGQLKHVMQDTVLEDESTGNSFDQEEYILDLQQADPRITDAIDLAPNFLTQAQIEDYDAKVNSGDLDQIHDALKYLLQEYESWQEEHQDQSSQKDSQADPEDDPSEQEQVVEWFNNLSDADIDNAVDEIYEMDLDENGIEQLQEASESFAEGSVHQDILNAGVMIANGQISADEAIEMITNQHGEASSAAAYFQLQSMLN